MRRFVIKFIPVATFIAILLFTTADSPGQFQKLKLKMISKILKKEPALSTSLDDAVTEVPFLDDYNPSRVSPLRKKPSQTPGIRYAFIPGCWGIRLKSYCLHAGKYRPGKGEGYLYAPLKGDWAAIIRSVLQKSVLHPKIPQPLVQSLIWGILARTKIKDMPVSMKLSAAKLLTPKEIYTINGGALGLIPKSLMDSALGGLPPAVRQVIEAEARIRDMLNAGIDSYEALERVAVRTGIAPRQKGDREVPGGRWSYHPDGFFVRYQPQGFPRTYMQISVPDLCRVEWDKKGCIISVADNRGNRLETTYEDKVKPLTLRGKTAPIGYAFHRLKLSQKKSEKSAVTKEWEGKGWTLISVPQKKSKLGGDSLEYYPDLDQNVEWAVSHQAQVKSICDQAGSAAWRNKLASRATRLGIFSHAAQNFLAGQSGGDREKATAAVNLLKEAWQNLIWLAMMKETPRRQTGSASVVPFYLPIGGYFGGNGGIAFSLGMASGQGGGSGGPCSGTDPSGGGSVPGRQGNQRLGMGGPEDEPPESADKYAEGYQEGYRDGFGYGVYDAVNGNEYNPPIPVEPLVPTDPDCMDGYRDGHDSGYEEGYNWGKSYMGG